MIRDVANRVILDNAVIQQIEKIASDRGSAASTRNSPREGQSPAAEAGAIIMYPRKMDAEEFIRIGGRVVREQQTESSGAGHIRVLGLGGGKYDPHIAAKLNSLKSSLKATLTEMGETSPDAQIADALSIIRSGGVPSGPLARAKPASLLAAISRLIFHVEPGRSPSALVTTGCRSTHLRRDRERSPRL